MNITLNIEAANPGELQEAIVGLAGIVGFVNDGTGIQLPTNKEDGEKPKRGNRAASKPDKAPTSDQTESKPVSKEEPKNEEGQGDTGGTDADTDKDTGGDEDIPTVVQLRAKAQEIGKTAEGKATIKALLEKFGSKSLSDVPDEKRAVFMAELDKL
ncbi:hypothetical protein QIH01_20305 [Brevibacillus brevis]|nr:hypothetical protein QIH01_20305 [Brevibacillus brevis]